MTDAQILAIDAGSQSLRAVLFDASGTIAASAALSAPDIARPQPGHAESEANDFWQATCTACSRLADQVPDLWRRVAGIAISAQRGTMLFLDQHGQATRPAILWSDTRRAGQLAALPPPVNIGTRLIGAHSRLQELRTQAPANWVVQHEPECWARTDKVVLLSAYLNFQLTGRWIDSSASQVGFVPFNFRKRLWYRGGHWRWRALGKLRPDQMVDLCPPGNLLGVLSAKAATQLDLPATTPVIAAAADKACEVLGCGARNPSDVALSFGTAVTVNLPHSRFRHVSRFIPAFPAAGTSGYLSEAQLERGLRVVPWFINSLRKRETWPGDQSHMSPESVLEHLLTTTTPGASGLSAELARLGVCATASALAPDADGTLQSLARTRDPALLYRGLIESLVFELRDELHTLTRAMDLQPQRLLAAGGGTRSPAIRQITADVLGLPVHCPDTVEATALGAAMCAASGLSWYDSIEQAQASMARPGTITQPDMTAHKIYLELP